jgi:AcrR family transcriptional regulator
MKTNRDEILESAFQLFMAMNYERVSLQMITKKVGLTKTGIFNYYPTKLDLFIAVADKCLFSGATDFGIYFSSVLCGIMSLSC